MKCALFVRCMLESCLAQTGLNSMLPHYLNDCKTASSKCLQYVVSNGYSTCTYTHTFADDIHTHRVKCKRIQTCIHIIKYVHILHNFDTNEDNTIEQLRFI